LSSNQPSAPLSSDQPSAPLSSDHPSAPLSSDRQPLLSDQCFPSGDQESLTSYQHLDSLANDSTIRQHVDDSRRSQSPDSSMRTAMLSLSKMKDDLALQNR
jgi:hypothetical protein